MLWPTLILPKSLRTALLLPTLLSAPLCPSLYYQVPIPWIFGASQGLDYVLPVSLHKDLVYLATTLLLPSVLHCPALGSYLKDE